MREIKFRAYDNLLKIMFSNKDIKLHNGDIFLGDEGEYERIEDCELMQYTGLLDKQGVEIYEGDIIENSIGEKYYVYFDIGCFFIHNIGHATDYHDISMYKCNSFGSVIGNIHENEELLNG